MNTVTLTAPTIELAIEKGLQQFNATREQVLIVVLQEGKKGFLGFGKQEAIVSMTLKPQEDVKETVDKKVESVIENKHVIAEVEPVVEKAQGTTDKVEQLEAEATLVSETASVQDKYQEVVDYLVSVSKEYGADITVSVKETTKKLIFQIETEKAGLLIGKYGKIINALQVLTQTMVYREDEKAPMVVVNIGDYRQKREEKLKEMADRTAKKVLRTRQAVYLEPLPAFERKIVHARISKYEQLVTQSEGKEPHRYLKVEFAGHTTSY